MAFRNRWHDTSEPTPDDLEQFRIENEKILARLNSKPAQTLKPKRKPTRRPIRSEGRTRYYNHHGKEIMGQITMKLYYDESDD